MKAIPQYHFHRTKYGNELLIDVVELRSIEKYIQKDPVHTLTYYDITLITEGNATLVVNNTAYAIQPNDVVFSIPGEVREWKDKSELNGYALIFEEEFLLSFFNDPNFLRNLPYLRIPMMLHLDGNLRDRIYQLILQIKVEIDLYQEKDKHILRAMLYEALMLFNRAHSTSGVVLQPTTNVANRHIEAFTTLVGTAFLTQRSPKYYAEKLCITTNYLNEIVQQAIGISTKGYILQKVMQEAKLLLSYTTLSVAEIAHKLNYSTPTYFIRSFRTHTGLTPAQYRETQKP